MGSRLRGRFEPTRRLEISKVPGLAEPERLEVSPPPRASLATYVTSGIIAFRRYYGPVLKAFAALDAAGGAALERDILALLDACNTARDGTLVAPSEYLEVVVTKGA